MLGQFEYTMMILYFVVILENRYETVACLHQNDETDHFD